MTTVYLRFAGWIHEVHLDENTGRTSPTKDGLIATCHSDGRADVVKMVNDSKIFDGLGTWSTNKYTEPGIRIEIRRKRIIRRADMSRKRIIDNTIRVYAEVDEDEFEYKFHYDGQDWTVSMDEAEEV
jgi:hypothetical protein